MEVWTRHARTRAIARDAVFPANRVDAAAVHASGDVARVVSDVSVLCPLVVAGLDTAFALRTLRVPELGVGVIAGVAEPSARRTFGKIVLISTKFRV
jgi:hypothetical protein